VYVCPPTCLRLRMDVRTRLSEREGYRLRRPRKIRREHSETKFGGCMATGIRMKAEPMTQDGQEQHTQTHTHTHTHTRTHTHTHTHKHTHTHSEKGRAPAYSGGELPQLWLQGLVVRPRLRGSTLRRLRQAGDLTLHAMRHGLVAFLTLAVEPFVG